MTKTITWSTFTAKIGEFDGDKTKFILLDSNHWNTVRRIWHYFTPLQIVRQKPNVKNYNEAL